VTNAEKSIILETHLPHPLFKRGKVRDIYDMGDKLLIVSTDRISAFDMVLPNGIPRKGEAITRLSTYWFEQTKSIIQNHIVKTVDPRTVLVKKAKLIPIEFVIRGYLYGAAWENYKQNKPICGITLPKGLRKAGKLPQPILTPTTKAEVGHDLEITQKNMEQEIGKEMAKKITEASMKIYEKASQKAEENGIIVADTKMEFGMLNNELILIDELLTPDSSRFWPLDRYKMDEDQFSFDKQYVRDYLLSIKWNKQPPAPTLPPNVVAETSEKYIEAYERLTGRKF
jgi:phosphoribosylaminoimidazole-succinocarboxamide synthase